MEIWNIWSINMESNTMKDEMNPVHNSYSASTPPWLMTGCLAPFKIMMDLCTKVHMTWIQRSNRCPPMQSCDHILHTQQLACVYGHLQYPAVTWPWFTIFFVRSQHLLPVSGKKHSLKTMGSFNNCAILLITTVFTHHQKKYHKIGSIFWWLI